MLSLVKVVRSVSAPSQLAVLARWGSSSSHSSSHSSHSSSASTGENIPYIIEEKERPYPQDGKIATDLEQSTGIEREELLAQLAGKERFPVDGPFTHFGTKKNPSIVYSGYKNRIMGCAGNCEKAEEPGFRVWWTLKTGEGGHCPECGQYFVVKALPGANLEESP